jgi:hypothetical protein
MDRGERMPERVTVGYSVRGPSGGSVGVPSTSFTVTLIYPANVAGTITITPNDGGAGGTFFPVSIALTAAAPSDVFNYTAASSGTKTLSTTNNGGLNNPRGLPYVAT